MDEEVKPLLEKLLEKLNYTPKAKAEEKLDAKDQQIAELEKQLAEPDPRDARLAELQAELDKRLAGGMKVDPSKAKLDNEPEVPGGEAEISEQEHQEFIRQLALGKDYKPPESKAVTEESLLKLAKVLSETINKGD